MKKFVALSLLLLSAVAFVPSAEAKSTTANNLTASTALTPQINIRLGNQRNRNRRTTRTYTRNVRQGRAIYRETYRVTYRPNGTTRTHLISRIRVGRY